ncbi:hypothetical protein ACSSS7_003284 [Eimeria intestinalis]
MVTTRHRKASAAPPAQFASRLDSGEATAGPFTLNKIDPKVSVSGARVDRQGLHVSLTIPLDSSNASVSSRTRTKTATIQPSSAAPHISQGHIAAPRSAARQSSRSPRSKAVLAAADVATQTSRDHDSKPKASRRAARSPQKERQRRPSPVIPPPISPPVSAAADEIALPEEEGAARTRTSQEAYLPSEKGAEKSRWLSRTRYSFRPRRRRTRSNTPKTRNASSENSRNPSAAPTIPPLVFEAHNARHPSQAALKEPNETAKVQENKLSKLEAPSLTHSSRAGESLAVASHPNQTSAGASQADASVADQLPTYSQGRVAADTEGSASRPPHCDDLRPSFKSIRTALAKFTFWPVLILIGLLVFFWGAVALWSLCFPSALAALRWTATQAGIFLFPNETKEVARGSFYLLSDPDQLQCGTPSDSCSKKEGSPCWLPTEDGSKGCVVLGKDVAAREAGGSIDYSLTTGAVPVKALRLSLLMHKVASFAMPRFPVMRAPSLPASLDPSEGEIATLRRSYFPLYNHENDPGKLLVDSSATYIMTHTQGQVVVALSRQAPVAAVAFETPPSLKPDGQCGPLEVRRFSVYVHLDDDSLKTTCPVVSLDAEGSSELTWCKVSTFEYRCSDSASLQVFCLHGFPKSPETGPPNVQNSRAACDFDKGWPTIRVKLHMESNWGAEATRIRRLRIFAGSPKPLLDRTT